MKKSGKLTTALLALVLLLGALPVCFSVVKAESEEYRSGDVIEFGSYPQTRVSDAELIAALNGLGDGTEWISYGYYSGNGEIGSMSQGDWMQYCDVTYDGLKYRGVYFTQYRPYVVYKEPTVDYTIQERNGYYPENRYWFRWEPLLWRILNSESEFVMCDILIDAQAYNNTVYYSDPYYYSDAEGTYYANDYINSSVRRWIEETFCTTAFTAEEYTLITESTLVNTSANPTANGQFNWEPTEEKVFLLSADEVRNPDYGFIADAWTEDPARMATGSDYAKCQGLLHVIGGEYDGNADWLLRSSGNLSYRVSGVSNQALILGIYSSCSTYGTLGIRPAFRFSPGTLRTLWEAGTATPTTDLTGADGPTVPEPVSVYSPGDVIEFGSYPQTRVTDAELIASLETSSADAAWRPMEYTDLAEDEYAFFKDVALDGETYRAVYYSRFNNPSPQQRYGYSLNTVFWFRFEPIEWTVLDPESGLLIANDILDTQPINRTVYSVYYSDAQHQYYLNNYAHSSIRGWLNGLFSEIAFSGAESGLLILNEQNNELTGMPESYTRYTFENTSDNVFLLSYDEAENEVWFPDDTSRIRVGTDYARALGLENYNDQNPAVFPDNDFWFLRSPGTNAYYQGCIDSTGEICTDPVESSSFDVGICPAVYIDLDGYARLYAHDEPTEPTTEPTDPTGVPENETGYEGLSFDFENGILTVSGSGSVPTEPDAEASPFAQYAQDCAALILGDGITTVGNSAFRSLTGLKSVVLCGGTRLCAGAFAANAALGTVICRDSVAVEDEAFAGTAAFSLYEEKTRPHSGSLPDACRVIPYSFADGTLYIEGSVTLDAYALFDLMTVMCGFYDDIRAVRFDSYTSEDLSFYVFNESTGRYSLSSEDTLTGAEFSVMVINGADEWENVTFNELCSLVAAGETDSFRLVTATSENEEIKDTDMTLIERVQEGIQRVLKWMVGLLNKIFQFFAKLKK